MVADCFVLLILKIIFFVHCTDLPVYLSYFFVVKIEKVSERAACARYSDLQLEWSSTKYH